MKTQDIRGIAEYIRSRNTGSVGEYTMCAGGSVTLYASCFAAMTLHYLGELSSLPANDKQAWADYINGWQDEDTGWFLGPELVNEELKSPKHDFEHLAMHLACHVLPALSLLGVKPKYDLLAARQFLDKTVLQNWLDARDWTDAWLEGNNLLFIGQFIVWMRDVEGRSEAQAALDLWFEWLDSEIDPQTGLWGTNGYCTPWEAMCGGYHQLLVYYYENRDVRSKKALINTTLSLQHDDGGFNPSGGGGPCEDADAADILVNMYKQINYRRPEIRFALRRLYRSILDKQKPDHGFVCKNDREFVHMGIEKTRSPANIPNLFGTWFRVHTIALIGEIIVDMPIGEFAWRFNDSCSMGWHRPWDKSKHPVGAFDRKEEFARGTAMRLVASQKRAYWKRRNQLSRFLRKYLLQ